MKREGWTPDWLNQCIDRYVADLPNRDEYIAKRAVKQFKKGDVRTDKIEEEVEKTEKLRAAVNEFSRMQKLMQDKKRYDFDDMINWVIRAFESHPSLLLQYQERYQYILVDEYQDTSGTQNRIVELLINFWEKPNVFVVGDDDQSIYRFQGANIENMLQFANNYKEHLFTVVLTNNYRSTQPILNISHTIIGRNDDRLVKQIPGLSKELIAAGPSMHLDHPPLLREYESQRLEMIGIAAEVRELISRGVSPGNIGILYKENKYGEELLRYLKLLNIPVYSKRHIDLLQEPLAKKIILLLNYLNAEHDVPYGGDEMLFELLHADWFAIPALEIAKLTAEVAEKRYGSEKTTLRRWLSEKASAPPKDLFSKSLPENMQKASATLEQLISDVPNLTLQQIFEKIIRTCGILSVIMKSPEKFQQLQIINTLFEFIREETRRNPSMTLGQLVWTLSLMTEEEIPLPLVLVSGSDKGVNLLTVHGAKGLEFEHVFFAGCNAAFWEKKRKPGGGYKLPDTVFASDPHVNEEEELRRLFFVALTRAEQHLYISYSRYRNDGRELEPSMFIAEINDTHRLPVEKVFIGQEVQEEFLALQFNEALMPEIEHAEEAFIDSLLAKFAMNVTALNNYLRCPLDFYFNTLIRIPSPKNEAAEFGSAVHYALEQLFRKMQEDSGQQFHSREKFLEDFQWYMNRHRESFTKEQFDRRMEYGLETLSNYYDQRIGTFSKVVAIERTIRNVQIDGIPLKGKLDKLEFDGKQVNVVDYKTGNPDNAMAKIKSPDDKNPHGGDYWRQAVFYKLLVDQYEQRGWQAVSTEFDFIEPDSKKKYRREKIVITPADVETVKQQIRTTWEKIHQRDFYTGCGKEDCHWCNFVKTHQLAIALHEIAPEESEQE
jgi:DNA helicase-2/ATP-dependent DNA helicase PcrA